MTDLRKKLQICVKNTDLGKKLQIFKAEKLHRFFESKRFDRDYFKQLLLMIWDFLANNFNHCVFTELKKLIRNTTDKKYVHLPLHHQKNFRITSKKFLTNYIN